MIELCPRLTGITRVIESVTGSSDVLLGTDNVEFVNVVIDTIGSLSPRFSAVVTDVDTADFDTGDESI